MPPERPSTGLKDRRQQTFSWLSISLFSLIFVYGLLGLFRVADFNVWGSLGLTLPATICGILGHADRLRSLTASIFGNHLSVSMNNSNGGARGGGNQSRRRARKTVTRNGESGGQTNKGESHAQKSP